MTTRRADYLEAIEHLPEGATLVFSNWTWEEYERLLGQMEPRPGLRVTYDDGEVQIVSPSKKHERYKELVAFLVRTFCDVRGIQLESYGSTTWRSRRLRKGTEPDTCFYVKNAPMMIGKDDDGPETDPPPDVAVEIDISHTSLNKLSIYAALGVPEVWRYDGSSVLFYELASGGYVVIAESRSLPGLTSSMLAEALEQSKREGQTAALLAFRERLGG